MTVEKSNEERWAAQDALHAAARNYMGEMLRDPSAHLKIVLEMNPELAEQLEGDEELTQQLEDELTVYFDSLYNHLDLIQSAMGDHNV